ncbi:MAG: agmatinase [Peptococcaceae bacterium]|nr:agmatinase [Peptococcaceae bacterium]
MNPNIMNFIAAEADFDEARAVIFGAPFDGTTSFRPGTRFGPGAIRAESDGIETYSPYQNKDLEDIAVFDSGDLLLPFGNTEAVLEEICARTAEILEAGKMPVMLGGEHLVTLGAVRAMVQKYPELRIIHFDAHTDLRDDYLGERLSHATVIRRCHDLLGDGRIHQFGIRSGERAEWDFAFAHTDFHPFNVKDVLDVVLALGSDVPVYVTLDLDVLDPSLFCGTGTPEAGGVFFQDLEEALLALEALNVVGFDMNELSPHYDASGVSTAVACKVLREMLLAYVK